MLYTPGNLLRSLRALYDLSLSDLATLTRYTKPYLGNIETGVKPLTPDVAAVCDAVFGGTNLTDLLRLLKEDEMLRRSLITGGALAALLTFADGQAALAQAITHDLRTAAAGDVDWDAVVGDYMSRYLAAPGPNFGPEVAAQLSVARHAILSGTPEQVADAARAAALLTMIYALHMGDRGSLPTAHGLHDTAAILADRSQDQQTRALVRARKGSRGPFEQLSYADTVTACGQALAICSSGPAAVEAHAARVHLHALTGNLNAGRSEVAAMRRAVDTITDPDAAQTASARTQMFAAYLECRTGTVDDARRAYAAAEPVLRNIPAWATDARLSYGRALIAGGATGAGASIVLDTITSDPAAGHIHRLEVADALAAARGARSDTLDELARYAGTGPYPWDRM